MDGMTWIDPGDIRFRRTDEGGLTAAWKDRAGAVTAKRLFPLSEPGGMVFIEAADGEWGMLRSAEGLAPDSRQALEREVRLHPCVPEIRAIVSLRRRNQYFQWETVTDLGPAVFMTGPPYESVAAGPGDARIVNDLSGRLYRLAPDSRLDSRSRRRLRGWM
jgi:hypothetical protein